MHDWPLLESAAEYETGWYTGGYDLVEQPDGSEKRYYWAELPPAVVVVARDGPDVLFVEQFRPTVRERCLELPAGIVEGHGGGETPVDRQFPEREGAAGESFEEAAARELREETGYEPADATLVEAFWCSTGVLRHRRGVVAATGLSEHADGRELDSNEFLEVTRVPAAEAVSRARERPVTDATLTALLLAVEEGLL